MYKSLFSMKNGINSVNILYADFYKRILMYYGQRVKKFKSAFEYICVELYELNTSHSYVQKNICCENGINSFKYSCRGFYKRLWVHYILFRNK